MLPTYQSVGEIYKPASKSDEDAGANQQNLATPTEGTTVDPRGHLRREFKERHVSMIAVAGAIWTGLIIGSGTGLVRGGPASLLIAYCIIGAIVYFLMTVLGEMVSMLPMDKGFAGYATRFVDPALGYAAGWNYFFKYAAGIIIQYWRPDLNTAIFVASFTVVIIAINVLHVSYFGEAEFWMSTVKLLVIIMLVLTCFIISLGGQPSGQRLGFSYWSDPGAFGSFLSTGTTGRFLGFWACIVQACFAYTGTEVVGVAFGEAPTPKRTVRRTVRQTLWRIVFFYIVGVLVLAQLAKINVFPDVINACLLVFVVSAANSDIYISSRTLYGLALDKQAPSVFRYTNTKGVPLAGIGMTSLFTVLAYMNVTKSSSTVFKYFVSLVTVFGTLNWINVLLSYIQFTRGMKAQCIGRETMPYRGPLQPYGAYCALTITMLITFFNGYNAFMPSFSVLTFLTSYIGIAVYIFNIASYKIITKSKAVGLQEMDLQTGRLEKDGTEESRTSRKIVHNVMEKLAWLPW